MAYGNPRRFTASPEKVRSPDAPPTTAKKEEGRTQGSVQVPVSTARYRPEQPSEHHARRGSVWQASLPAASPQETGTEGTQPQTAEEAVAENVTH